MRTIDETTLQSYKNHIYTQEKSQNTIDKYIRDIRTFQQAQATADDAEQTELYKQMERNLTEHAANVYIQDLADLVVLRNGLEGYQFYPIYVMDLSTVHYAQ